jgi:hypothetical protein
MTVANCVADRIAINLTIEWLDSDLRLLTVFENESRIKIYINASNFGNIDHPFPKSIIG